MINNQDHNSDIQRDCLLVTFFVKEEAHGWGCSCYCKISSRVECEINIMQTSKIDLPMLKTNIAISQQTVDGLCALSEHGLGLARLAAPGLLNDAGKYECQVAQAFASSCI